MRIAPATPEHLPFVLELASATLKAHCTLNPRAFSPRKNFGLTELHKVAISCPADGPWTFLAWSDAKVEGYVTVKPLKNASMIYDICVRPEARGKGVGRLLLNHALAHSRERNWKILVAIVWDGNDASHRLFQSAGFNSGRRSMLARFFPRFRSTAYVQNLQD